MIPISAKDFAAAVEAQSSSAESPITGFATDSREVKPGDLFIAIRGESVDGYNFVPQALHAGASAALVERPTKGPHFLVDSVVEALARFASKRRASFLGPVVAITGSAGKTTTKEFVAAAMSPLGPVLKSQGNRNTEYTSPLLWAELAPDTCAVVVEMSMRGFGQIAHLAKMAAPTVGLITNIGFAHVMQVGNRDGIARAKGELLEALPSQGISILWHECEYLTMLRDAAGERKVWTFGFADGADCQITSYKPDGWSCAHLAGVCFGHRWRGSVPAVGRHVALDACAAVLTAASLGVDLEEACEALARATLPPMRMEVRKVREATVLLDTYNASPPSMISALETLAEAPAQGRRLAILGEMRELGEYAPEGHRAVGSALRRLPIDSVLFIGDSMRFAIEEAANPAHRVGTIDDAAALIERLEPGDVVLVKGSRALELERALETTSV